MDQLKKYDDMTANKMASHFFSEQYHDPGIQKWGGFRTGQWMQSIKKEEKNLTKVLHN
ncbi:hypothetical protein [Limosilactobacillus sp.]|uniref:hypothetical protein n=1 Tax=Limosilactobacillus sp. TaxID=2773925 RepID=UPI00345E6726